MYKRQVYKGNSIKLSWLNNEFQDLPHDADNVVIAQPARAHILTLIGSLLIPDTSGGRVHLMYLLLLSDLNNVSNYSWGSGVLACLYRALDHGVDFNQENIGGCMLLLQCWAWTASHAFLLHFTDLVMLMLLMALGFH